REKLIISITRLWEIVHPLVYERQRHERRRIVGVRREQRLQLANRLRKFVGCKIGLDQQIVGAGKIRIELERPLKLCLGWIPFSFRSQDFAFKKMGGRRIGRFLELTPYPLPGSVEMLVQQVQIDELIDRKQIIRRDFGGFFKCPARFVIFFRLAQGLAERYLGLWILRREPGLLLKDHGGIVEPIKGAISRAQEQRSVPQI